MNQIPKVMVTPTTGGWSTSCPSPGCGFTFRHVRREVVDEQAIDHQRNHMKKSGGARWTG